MLTIKEAKALAKVSGITVEAVRWLYGREEGHPPLVKWEGVVKCGTTVLCVGPTEDTQRAAMASVWIKYRRQED